MKRRIILEEDDIIEMIAEKYNIDPSEIKVEVEEHRSDWGDSVSEARYVFDEPDTPSSHNVEGLGETYDSSGRLIHYKEDNDNVVPSFSLCEMLKEKDGNVVSPLPCDMFKEKDGTLVISLAGYRKEDVEISTDEDCLIISTKKDYKFPAKSVFHIPETKFNFNQISTSFENGILTVQIPPIKKNETYDSNGRLIHCKEDNGYEAWWEYNSAGKVIHFRNSSGFEEWHKYDSEGREIFYKNSNGYEKCSRFDK